MNEQKQIVFRNRCNAIFDEQMLRDAILKAATRPVCRLKDVFLHQRYPAISIGGKKYQVHRFVFSFYIGKPIPDGVYVHHKNGNKLDCTIENLCLMRASCHQSLHNKGKTQSEIHRKRISEANYRRWAAYRINRGIHDKEFQ